MVYGELHRIRKTAMLLENAVALFEKSENMSISPYHITKK